MSGDDEGVLEAARAIRPYLPDLVEPGAVAELDHRLGEELTDTSDRREATRRLRALLSRHDGTAWFLTEVLGDGPHFRPPYYQPRFTPRGGIAPPAGDPDRILHAGRYVCRQGDYVWYRPAVGTPVPRCPTHPNITLTHG